MNGTWNSAEGAELEAAPPSRWTVPGVVVLATLFDFCFWDRSGFPGLALSLFFAAAAGVIALNRAAENWNRLARWLLVLLAGAVGQAAVESSTCNMLLLMGLTLALAGETAFARHAAGLPRWFAQLRALALAPFRVMRLGFELARWASKFRGAAGLAAGFVVIVVPTVLLLLVFGTLLSNANAVVALWSKDAFAWVWNLIPAMTFWRMVLWCFVGAVAVPLLWPKVTSPPATNGSALLVRWAEVAPPRLALQASVTILVAMNLLFAVANFADAEFLWHGGTLPAGVNYSTFVHEGVELLIATVLLSALVLATIFNQVEAVAGRSAKALGGVWILQNLFLVVSTARRLELYIEAYGASVQRFSTLIFLLLVVAGFGFLAVMIVRQNSLRWLLGRSLAAAFVTVYVAQFLNLTGWVADYNVRRWQADPSRDLDVRYLSELGPGAWPANAEARKLGAVGWMDDGRSEWPQTPAEQEEQFPRTRLDGGHWREFSLRAWWNRGAMVEKADKK